MSAAASDVEQSQRAAVGVKERNVNWCRVCYISTRGPHNETFLEPCFLQIPDCPNKQQTAPLSQQPGPPALASLRPLYFISGHFMIDYDSEL